MELVKHSANSYSSVVLSSTVSVAALRDPATNLDSMSLLRAVRFSTLMARGGLLLAKPPHGSQYDMSAEKADALYQTSERTDSIDWFISHSWRDSRWLKYMSIAWLINHKHALIAAASWSALWILAETCGMCPRYETDITLGDRVGYNSTLCSSWDCHWRERQGFAKDIYVFVFLVVLLFRTICVRRSREVNFFLDKVCIHQTNPARKAQGILNLGGFLRQSRRLLLLWSPDYFDRLWCNYEVACFTSLAGIEKVDVIPLWVPKFEILLILSFPAKACIESVEASLCDAPCPERIRLAKNLLIITIDLSFVIVPFFRAARRRAELRKQLAAFTWSRTRCYCCDVNHMIPGTETSIPCDRVFVENNITRWFREFGARGESGIQTFERCVRENLGRNVRRLMGPSVIPVPAMVNFMNMTLLDHVEKLVINPHLGWSSIGRGIITTLLPVLVGFIWQGTVGCRVNVSSIGSRYSWICDISLGFIFLAAYKQIEFKLYTATMLFWLQGHLWHAIFLYCFLAFIAVSLYKIVP